MTHLVVSYARADRARLHDLQRLLEASTGQPVWLADDASPDEVVQRAIDSSVGVLFAVSASSVQSEQPTLRDLAWALARTGMVPASAPRLLVVRLDPVDLPAALRDLTVIDAVGRELEQVAADLVAALPRAQDQGAALRPRLATFAGREALLATLHRTLHSMDRPEMARPVVLHGPAGSGKTQLALEYAHRQRATYPGGIFWIDGGRAWAHGIGMLAETLGLSAAGPTPDLAQRDHLLVAAFHRLLLQRQDDALLIVDGAANPADIMQREIGPNLHITDLHARLLITSEQAAALADFDLLEVGPLAPDEALAVLHAACPACPALDRLAAYLGGLPLVLSLAAGALRGTPVEDVEALLAALQAHVPGQDVPPAERDPAAVRVLMDWHWARLDDAARQVLMLAAAYADGPVPLARLGLLAASADDLPPALAALTAANLIETHAPDTIGVHRLIREHVIRRALPDPALPHAARRLVEAYRTPQRIQAEAGARGILALRDDLAATRLALAAVGQRLDALYRLERLLDWEAYHLHGGQPDAGRGPIYLIQHIRERAHHQGDRELGDRCDAWLAGYAHLRTADAWRFPLDPAPLRVLKGHAEPVLIARVLPDGRRAISASDIPAMRLWDVETGETLRVLEGHAEPVYDIAVLPDGRRALSVSDDLTLRLWDVETGETLRVLEGHTGSVRSVSILPDGRRALSASWDGTLRLWDVETGETLRVLEGHARSINSVIVLPDGQRALSASFDRSLRLWDLDSGELLHSFEGHQGLVLGVALVPPDYRRVLSASNDRSVRVWDLETGAALYVLEGHSGSVSAVVALPDGRRAISASADRTLRLWDLDSGSTLRVLRGHQGPVNGVTALPDGRRVISASEDGTLRLWDVQSADEPIPPVRERGWSIRSLTLLPGGEQALSASFDGTLQLWDLAAGQGRRLTPGRTEPILKLAALPDGRHVLSSLSDGALRLWNLESGETIRILHGHSSGVLGLAALPDGRRALSAAYDGSLRLWDVESGETIRIMAGHDDLVNALIVLPQGRRAISASGDRTLRLWDLDAGAALRVLKGHTGPVLSVAALPGSQQVISAGGDGMLRVWELETGAMLRTLAGHRAAVRDVAALPDGRHAISASYDHTLRLWDLAAGTQLAVLHLVEEPVCLAAVDARRVVLGDNAGDVRVLEVWLGQVI